MAYQISVHFLTCKTKVAPLKASENPSLLSIPRLELCAALLLAQTLDRVKTKLSSELPLSCVYAWSDSTVVLSWLTTHQKTFKIFVSNRIAKIHALLPDCEWFYVNTAENPADLASRVLLPAATVSCKLHRVGPSFLLSPEDQWPSRLFTPLQPEQLPDFQPSSSSVHTVTFSTPPDEILRRFSSLIRMQRSLAYIRRFTFKARGQPLEKGPLRRDELENILMRAVRMTQDTYLSDLRKQLTNQSDHMKRTSIAQLAPFIDANGLIRVGRRLRYASLDPDAKQPMLLPKVSHLTSLIIEYYHQGIMHAGPKLVLAIVRY